MKVSEKVIEWSDACRGLLNQMSEFSCEFSEVQSHAYPLADTAMLRGMAGGNAGGWRTVGSGLRGRDAGLPGRGGDIDRRGTRADCRGLCQPPAPRDAPAVRSDGRLRPEEKE